MDVKKRIDWLSRELLRHQYLYYVLAHPEISDREYDRMFDELVDLERRHPDFAHANSPTARIGSDLDHDFPERPHTIRVLSLDKVYTPEELGQWMEKIQKQAPTGFVFEEKIDGASIVLYYDRGELQHALTRGNGITGNDVTENVRTIPQVPLTVAESAPFAVRGEIFITRADFQKLITEMEEGYANPRNLASGSLRNAKSALTARIPLQIFVYDSHFPSFPPADQLENLTRLRTLGFRINDRLAFFSSDRGRRQEWEREFPGSAADPHRFREYLGRVREGRSALPYDIDGLVVKVEKSSLRETLGYTSHHPRWAMAFKFEAPAGATVLTDITIQIGRNGRVTPVALLKPVHLAGSTVSRATLHNQEYINLLELGIGDEVTISKRGDVIPAVDRVIEKNPAAPTIFKLPDTCPFCRTELKREGAHRFCKNEECPERKRRAIIHFAAKGQMDIETLGEKTIAFLFDKGWIREIPDLFTFDYQRLMGEEGFGEKKIANIQASLEMSKKKPFAVVLTALGLEGIGSSAVEILIKNGFTAIDRILTTARQNDPQLFSGIEGIGPVTAGLLIRHFTDPTTLKIIDQLQAIGLKFISEPAAIAIPSGDSMKGQSWVITGSFEHFSPRSQAAEEIIKRGGKIVSAVSAKTTHLLSGKEPGSKLKKARSLSICIVEEAEFLRLLEK